MNNPLPYCWIFQSSEYRTESGLLRCETSAASAGLRVSVDGRGGVGGEKSAAASSRPSSRGHIGKPHHPHHHHRSSDPGMSSSTSTSEFHHHHNLHHTHAGGLQPLSQVWPLTNLSLRFRPLHLANWLGAPPLSHYRSLFDIGGSLPARTRPVSSYYIDFYSNSDVINDGK